MSSATAALRGLTSRSYHSMLSGVFKVVLPEISSSCGLHDHIRSFEIEFLTMSIGFLRWFLGPFMVMIISRWPAFLVGCC